ncbi:MtrB/PioB family decaheme-associated outer membrane protein [Ferrimonas lipolytica]|uniref:MtrB/PioB family decaheme-associated outer membrane protein n=1 Tax=Ferrimonas lipolytica TaxID=2724191 RepID=A0A6H1UAD3_9GAMM|nr:MtrB/PioB family decaheme-associated outer membrane protein [Ferrimonas lipolytica]QIZ76017.1 MtrB/PioB family decaheme-associated outer membrane protein [Ferrimonas lipolytica]
MKLHLNLITLALVSMSGSAMANYGLANANTDKVNLDKWQCKRCVTTDGASGSVGISAGTVDSNDIHANNAFMGDEDGAIYGVNADLTYRRAGHQATLKMDNLGRENSTASMSAGKMGVAVLQADYATYTSYKGTAQSQYVTSGDSLTATGELVDQDLKLERERYGFALDAEIGMVETYANFRREDKTGNRSASIGGLTATNIVQAVDTTTDRWEAGARLVGANWFAGVGYVYSEFDNNQGAAIDFNGYQDALAYEPSNDAYQIIANGAYQFGRSNISARFVSGEMNQDSNTISSTSVAAFDGKVETIDANIKFTTLATNRLRLTAGVDYSDRDNKSSILAGTDFTVDPISGELEEVTLLDTTKTDLDLGASYRIASGYRVDGKYEYQQKQRTAEGWDEEETQDHAGTIKLRVTAFDKWDIAVKGGYSHRDLSEYDADRLTASEDNTLLRRYNLADRDRTEAKLEVTHTPLDNLAIDFNGYWALDDYDNTDIGLTEGEDYGFDLGLSYQIGKANLHVYGGQQWINTEQQGSSGGSGSANWFTDVEDEFVHLGFGADYQLLENTVVGVDYLYADSTSDTVMKQGVTVPYDDYFATSHSVNLFTEVEIRTGMAVRLDYQYERFEETDYGNVDPYEVDNLVTLGNLDHNYNAHLIMLSFSYDL